MRKTIVLTALALLALGFDSAIGEYRGYLGPLHEAAVAARAEVPADATRKEKKRGKLLDKLVRMLSNSSGDTDLRDLTGNLKLNRRAASFVVKKKLDADEGIRDALQAALGAFRDELAELENLQWGVLSEIGESERRSAAMGKLGKYARFVDQTTSHLTAAGVAKKLVKARRKLNSIERKVAKALRQSDVGPCSSQPGSLTATEIRLFDDGWPEDEFDSTYVMAQIHRDPDTGSATRILLRAVGYTHYYIGPIPDDGSGRMDKRASRIGLDLKGDPLIGPGRHEIDRGAIDLHFGNNKWEAYSGSITLTEVDLAGGRIAGRFLVGWWSGGFGPDLSGSFEADCVQVCDPCEPFFFHWALPPR